MNSKYSKVVLLLIPVVSVLLHWNFFKLDLVGIHVWRQTQTQTVINNFATEDFNILHPKYNTNPDTDRIMRVEFPIMQWLFAFFFKVFGPHIIISRVLTFIIGLFSVFGMYVLLKNIFDNSILAAFGTWAFNFSPEFFYYTINPLPDNFSLCCAIWSVALFWKWINSRRLIYLIGSFLLLGLAVLSKLPFILYASVPLAYVLTDFVHNKRKNIKENLVLLFLLGISLVPAVVWYIMVIPTWNGNGVIKGIGDNHLSILKLSHILFWNFFSILPELLINYGSLPFFICSFYFLVKNKSYNKTRFVIFVIWSLSVLSYFFFELNMITTVHDYYLFPFLPLIFILVAYGAYHLYNFARYTKYLVIVLLLILPLTAYLRVVGRFDTVRPEFNGDFYRYKNELRNLVGQNDYCVVGNDLSNFIVLYYIDKKGWCFSDNYLPEEQLTNWIGKGAKYLYTDSYIDTLPLIKRHLSDKIFDRNSVRVYRLKSN